jgi:hypothetical protein
MAIIPTGQPAWTRTASHTNYGGHVNKRNYLSRGKIDALTDVGAEEICRMAADLEAIARTAPFATITFLCNDTFPLSGDAPTIETAMLMTGVRLTSYAGGAPPTGYPSAARNGDGDVTFTFDASYSDAYGVAGAFAIKHAVGNVHGTTAGEAVFEILTATTLRVRLFDGASALVDPRATIMVW